MNKQWCVYVHTNLKNGKKYIGITSQIPERRWANGNGYAYNPYFYNAILKYGWNSFSHDILLSGLTERAAKEKEMELIALHNTTDGTYGYNLTRGGDGATGRRVSEETKQKIRESHIGLTHTEESKAKISRRLIGNQYAKGHKHSLVTRKLISNALVGNQRAKGKQLSAETKAKMSKSHTGMKLSKETRKKISESNKTRVISEETKLKISIANTGKTYRSMPVDMFTIDNSFVKTFSSARDASRETGVDNSSISKVCNGKQRSAGGYKWQFHTDNIN